MGLARELRQRRRARERMDEPDLEAGLHREALRALARLNRLAGSARNLWREIAPLAPAAGSGVPALRVLDLATGGGDVPLALAQRAAGAGRAVEVDGCDRSPIAIAEARRAAGGAGSRFFVLDAVLEPLPEGYDVLACSLFLHHLSEGEAVALLARMAGAARRTVLVQDLARSATGMRLARLATALLTRDEVTRVDGPLSVAAAFTPGEALELAERAGLRGAILRPVFPCRWMLRWDRARV